MAKQSDVKCCSLCGVSPANSDLEFFLELCLLSTPTNGVSHPTLVKFATRKPSTSIDQSGSNFVARTMKDVLKNGDTSERDPNAKRQRSSVVVVPNATSPRPSIDRKTVCPILVRVFYSTDGRHTPLSCFSSGKFPQSELHINTWLDVNLKDLSHEVLYAVKSLPGGAVGNRRHSLRLGRTTRFHFASIYPDPIQRGSYRKRDLGSYIIHPRVINDEEEKDVTGDGDITLESKHFQIGDYLDVAISTFEEMRGSLAEEGNRASYHRRIHDRSEAARF
ncbi:Histone deacetylase complex subunit SAP18 [Taenia crassiceps]|uniref:18 kDa Sin3-associated polypeptide n=1 Tax=Taenia crassiceps TaxID=6207 RepID=A0ABR4Q9G4_9CEST